MIFANSTAFVARTAKRRTGVQRWRVKSSPVRLLAVRSRLGRTLITGPAVTASGTVTPGYLPASYEPQRQKSDPGFVVSEIRWQATSSCLLRCGQFYFFNLRRVIRLGL